MWKLLKLNSLTIQSLLDKDFFFFFKFQLWFKSGFFSVKLS